MRSLVGLILGLVLLLGLGGSAWFFWPQLMAFWHQIIDFVRQMTVINWGEAIGAIFVPLAIILILSDMSNNQS